MLDISADEARRIALGAQGFGGRRTNGRGGVSSLRRVIDRTKLLQIDSVNVLVRSHYMPVFSRMGAYSPTLLDKSAYERRELVEYWGRMASFIPMSMWPLFGWRRERPHHRFAAWANANASYIESVVAELTERGPLSAADLEEEGERRRGTWWDWRKSKSALVWLFGRGRVAVSKRRNFEQLYDLSERVVPPEILSHEVELEDAQKELIVSAADAVGIGTAKDLAGYFGIGVKAGHARIAELVEAGRLVPAKVEGWKHQAYMHPRAKTPKSVDTDALLTPFDTLIWERDRTERLFGFYYRIEIYVPAPKRVHGYYVLPFLMGDRLVGRVDLKSDRKRSSLLVQSAFAEPGTDKTKIAVRLATQLRSMADWLGLESVRVGRRGDLSASLRKERL